MAGNTSPRRIVIGVDGSKNSLQAIDWTLQNAHEGDTLVLVSAWSPVVVPADMAVSYTFDDTGARALLDGEVKRVTPLAEARGLKVEGVFDNVDPRTALLSAKADMIVVGSRGHGGIAGLVLGSVADYVSRHSKVPVVIVPHT